MLELGIIATVNSDDPAYFGGYVNENYKVLAENLELTKQDILTLARNGFEASFASQVEKRSMLRKLAAHAV